MNVTMFIQVYRLTYNAVVSVFSIRTSVDLINVLVKKTKAGLSAGSPQKIVSFIKYENMHNAS